MSVSAAVRAITALVDDKLERVKPFRAIVTSVSGGLVGIRRPEATTASTATYARLAGSQIQVGDEVLCVNVGTFPIVLQKIQRSAPASVPFEAAISAPGASLTGDLTLGAHLLSGTTVMGFAVGAAAGATGSIAGSAGTDVAGVLQVIPNGAGIAAGTIATLTFGAVMPSGNYAVVLTPASSAARTLGGVVGPTSRATNNFVIQTATALTAGSTYQWLYLIVSYG